MTICNMSIEAGARAGMIAPDETTFEYLQRPPARPAGRRLGRRRRVLEHAAHRRRRRVRRRGRARRRRPRARSSPGAPTPARALPLSGSVPDPEDVRRRTSARPPPSVRWSTWTWTPGTPLREIARGHRVHRLVHERPDRGPARGGRRGASGPRKADGVRMLVVPGTRTGAAAGRGRGARQGLRRLRRRVAQRRLLDVPGHEPRPAGAGGAQRVHVQPQLRGPPGQGRPHAPRLARSSPPRPLSAARSRAPRTSSRPRPRRVRPVDPLRRTEPWRSSPRTPASASRCGAATSTPTRSSPPSTSSASRAPGFEDGLFAAWRGGPGRSS